MFKPIDKLELGPKGREIGNLSCAGLVVDGDLETGLKGLFAAGDEVGGTPFTASTGAFELKQGLERLYEIREIPLRAANPHELGRCFEVLFVLTNADMLMRASLAREESRKFPTKFLRADFPEQDDKNWGIDSKSRGYP